MLTDPDSLAIVGHKLAARCRRKIRAARAELDDARSRLRRMADDRGAPARRRPSVRRKPDWPSLLRH